MKIAFAMTSLSTGGIATSVKNLLYELARKENIEIDLILFHTGQEDRHDIPENVRILSAGKMAELIAVSQKDSLKIGFRYSLLRAVLGGICKCVGHGIVYRFIFAHSSKFEEYDIAISCSQSAPLKRMYGGCNEFVLYNLESKKKVSFIHCDYVTYRINDKYSHQIYEKFDKIAAVSESVKNIFVSAEPTLSEKVVTVYNCNNVQKIWGLARENPVIYDTSIINFITVARFGKEKGHIRVLPALKNLKGKKINAKWHIVGGEKEDAPQRFMDLAKEYDVLDYIEFHGNQNNPYRFMLNSDFILVPSYHEAAPMVFDEAHILNIPVVTTNTASAIEMIRDKKIGLVCDNSTQGITDVLEKVISNPAVLEKLKQKTYINKYDEQLPINQFMELIEEMKAEE